MISVVIPAHDEEAVIGRLLRGLLASARPGEIEIHVVCNGCTDETATVAAGFGCAVHVVETPVASKAAALNLGDQAATAFPRFFVDADVEMSTDDLRAVASVLEEGLVLSAAPRIRFDLTGASMGVRLYHRFWQTMPYFDDSLVGSGVYALSAEGRRRFDKFPQIIADDQFVKEQFAPHERRMVDSSMFVKHPPRTLRSLVRTRRRVFAGRLELARRRAVSGVGGAEPQGRGGGGTRLRAVAAEPGLWVAGVVYTVVYALAWVGAYVKVRSGHMRTWERDETSRAAR